MYYKLYSFSYSIIYKSYYKYVKSIYQPQYKAFQHFLYYSLGFLHYEVMRQTPVTIIKTDLARGQPFTCLNII